MADRSLESILGQVTLTGLIQKTTTGLPSVLPPEFSAVTQQVIADEGKYTTLTGTRTVSRLVQYGAPSLRRALKSVGEKNVKLAHTHEHILLEPKLMQRLRSYTSYENNLGKQEVARQCSEFKQNFDNLRQTTALLAIGNGAVYFDGNGNLLPSSSGAVETIDFGMNANNQNQLNGVIAARWDLANTDIPSQLRALKKAAARATGYPLRYAFYGENIPSYFIKNDYVQEYLAREGKPRGDYLASAEMPDLFGLTWIPVYEAFWEDQAGTNQDVWSANKVVFTPAPNVGTWWEVLEGSFLVPTTLNVAAQGTAAYDSLKMVWGQFGYGVCMLDPVTVSVHYGDTFLPVVKAPDCIYQATVVF